MHELGVVMEVVRVVEAFAQENEVEEVATIILQVGELSSMIPKYIKDVYPAAVDGTTLENAELEIEVIPANGRCGSCHTVFHVPEHHGACPTCRGTQFEMLSGREFYIKEIVCY
ncbi:hydrogenase maturation nickel metallochaperone HypA/HybF [Kineothrix sp. MB12-C1]|uniref:hydrogenase maturation nickel metallochaperone HypA/HybF n=1 Tax=Kineothrix sp. MB12-C1 TaxID=3070215 RepID=UPI0027D2E83A|nr:hydrogenase maturation nickel metallochaperone HypA [Kineothrix sp. MB12-C1]WMC93328.1 hydrogenase maturation nickel metallochaperone HypA [Kineothrix sp. MB12-C1]